MRTEISGTIDNIQIELSSANQSYYFRRISTFTFDEWHCPKLWFYHEIFHLK